MNAAEAERIARVLFGVAGRASPLAGERDDNFRLDTAATRYVLKLHAPDTDPAELEFQDLAIAQAGTPLLAGRTTRAGERFARLLSWVDGTPWAEAGPWEPALMRELGRTVARVDRALARVDHPSKMRPHRWNMLDAPPLTASTPSGFVADALHSFHELRPSLDALPWQVIHNDANDHNVLVDETATRITGLLDLGDAVWSVVVNELAVGAAYAALDADDPLVVVAAIRSGFEAELPLTDSERGVLPELVALRLATSVALSAHQSRLDPDDPYLTISEAPAWALLERLAAVEPAAAAARVADQP